MVSEPRSERLKREHDMREDERRDSFTVPYDGDTQAEKWAREDDRAGGYAERPEWRGAA